MKTCLTCKHFQWTDGGTCGEGTCSEASEMKCSKGLFHVKSYDSGHSQQEAIMTARFCSDYKPATGE